MSVGVSAADPPEGSPGPPSARTVRRSLRGARRRSGAAKPLAETLQNVYVTAFAVAMLAAIGGPSTARVLRDVEERAASPALAASMVTATLLAAAGAVLGALLIVGPVVRDPADVTWLLASPVRRRGLLAPVALVLITAGTVAGGVVATAASVLVPTAHLAVWLGSGAAGGLLVVGVAVVTQPRERLRTAARRAATVLTGAALVVLVAGLATDRRVHVGVPSGVTWPLLVALLVPAVATLALVPSALDRLRRQQLTAGAGLALGLRATVTTLDGSFVAETMRTRRLLEHGVVRRRPLAGSGWVALVVADVRRVTRSPRALAGPLALVPVAWMVARLYGDVAATAAVVLLAWATAGASCAGLRTVARSAGVARSLPFPDTVLRATHCVVPALVAAVVALLACALSGRPLWFAGAAAACGVAGVLRTSAGRRPVKWELQAASPLGAMPVGAVMSYVVGIDVVAVTAIPLLVGLDPALSVALPGAAALLLLRQRRRD